MTVSEIIPISKKKSKIFIDEEFAFVLYKGELRLYKIKEEMPITGEAYLEITQTVLPKRARLRALHLLKNRPYTEERLKMKLREGYYGEAVIAEAISYVKSCGYINDYEYARQYLLFHAGKISKKMLKEKLRQKGIAGEIIEEAIVVFEEENGAIDEAAQIRRLLAKRNYNSENADRKEMQKLMGFLYRKGFSMEKIRIALNINEEYESEYEEFNSNT